MKGWGEYQKQGVVKRILKKGYESEIRNKRNTEKREKEGRGGEELWEQEVKQ